MFFCSYEASLLLSVNPNCPLRWPFPPFSSTSSSMALDTTWGFGQTLHQEVHWRWYGKTIVQNKRIEKQLRSTGGDMGKLSYKTKELRNKLASLEATRAWNYESLTDLLTRVKCRATSVAKKKSWSKADLSAQANCIEGLSTSLPIAMNEKK